MGNLMAFIPQNYAKRSPKDPPWMGKKMGKNRLSGGHVQEATDRPRLAMTPSPTEFIPVGNGALF